jgi:hypothetical protein
MSASLVAVGAAALPTITRRENSPDLCEAIPKQAGTVSVQVQAIVVIMLLSAIWKA